MSIKSSIDDSSRLWLWLNGLIEVFAWIIKAWPEPCVVYNVVSRGLWLQWAVLLRPAGGRDCVWRRACAAGLSGSGRGSYRGALDEERGPAAGERARAGPGQRLAAHQRLGAGRPGLLPVPRPQHIRSHPEPNIQPDNHRYVHREDYCHVFL